MLYLSSRVNMQTQKIIEQLGYSDKEAKVYLASLSLGEAHVSDIANKLHMPHSTVQVVVDRLHKDGLMNFYVMRRYKYWVAEKPEVLLKNLQKKEALIKEALPKLSSLRNQGRSGQRRDKNYKKSIDAFQRFADASPQPVLITNSDSEIEYVNTSWQDVFGYTLDEVHGDNPRIFKSGKTPNSVYDLMHQALHKGAIFQSDEIVDICKDQTCVHVLTTIFPVKHGGRTFFIQILNVITKEAC